MKIAICFVVSLFEQCACSMLISCPDFNMWCWYCSVHFYKSHLRRQLFLVILYEIECFDWSPQDSWKVIQDFNQTFKTVEDVSMIEDKWLMIGRELILKLYMLKIFTSWRIVSHFVVFCLGIEWCLCQFFLILREGILFWKPFFFWDLIVAIIICQYLDVLPLVIFNMQGATWIWFYPIFRSCWCCWR